MTEIFWLPFAQKKGLFNHMARDYATLLFLADQGWYLRAADRVADRAAWMKRTALGYFRQIRHHAGDLV